MTNLARYHAANLPELFERINRNSIGMEDYLNRFFNDTRTENYPPYNIVQVNNVETVSYTHLTLPTSDLV